MQIYFKNYVTCISMFLLLSAQSISAAEAAATVTRAPEPAAVLGKYIFLGLFSCVGAMTVYNAVTTPTSVMPPRVVGTPSVTKGTPQAATVTPNTRFVSAPPVGLEQLNNSCYLNAIIQMLCHLAPTIISREYKPGTVAAAFQQTLKGLAEHTKDGAFSPRDIHSCITCLKGYSFPQGVQCDGHEVLCVLLTSLDEDDTQHNEQYPECNKQYNNFTVGCSESGRCETCTQGFDAPPQRNHMVSVLIENDTVANDTMLAGLLYEQRQRIQQVRCGGAACVQTVRIRIFEELMNFNIPSDSTGAIKKELEPFRTAFINNVTVLSKPQQIIDNLRSLNMNEQLLKQLDEFLSERITINDRQVVRIHELFTRISNQARPVSSSFITIQPLPETIIVHLQRFRWDKGYAEKITKRFPFLYDNLPATAFGEKEGTGRLYDLHGIMIHSGGTPYSGHYWAYIKRADQWFCCNDSCIKPIDTSAVQAVAEGADALAYDGSTVGGQPYILLYKRRVAPA